MKTTASSAGNRPWLALASDRSQWLPPYREAFATTDHTPLFHSQKAILVPLTPPAPYVVMAGGAAKVTQRVAYDSALMGELQPGTGCVVDSMMELDGKRMRARIVEPVLGWVTASLLCCSDGNCGRCKRCDSVALQRRQKEDEERAARLDVVSTRTRLEETRRKLHEIQSEPPVVADPSDPSVVKVPSGSPNSPFVVAGVSEIKLSEGAAHDSAAVGSLAPGTVVRVDLFLEIDGKRLDPNPNPNTDFPGPPCL